MYTFLLVCHVVITIFLVGVVLLQSGKGGGLGAGFGGGGANTLFGSSGGSNFFTKLTMVLAGGFMFTSLALTVVHSHTLKTSIFDQAGHQTQTAPITPVNSATGTPVTEAPPTQPTATPTPTPGAAPLAQPGAPAAIPTTPKK